MGNVRSIRHGFGGIGKAAEDELKQSGVDLRVVGSHDPEHVPFQTVATVPEPTDLVAERVARELSARLFRDALSSNGCSMASFGDAAGVSSTKVKVCAQSEDNSSPSLRHLFLAARKHTKVVATIARSLLQMTENTRYSVRPFQDRVMDLMIGVGKLTETFRAAMADGELSEDERRELRILINRTECTLAGMKRALGSEG